MIADNIEDNESKSKWNAVGYLGAQDYTADMDGHFLFLVLL